MKATCLFLAGACLVASASVSNAQYFPEHRWSHGYGDTGTDAAYGVAVDGGGRVILVGSFEGSVDFGGGPLASAGSTDVFVVLYDLYGAPVWSRRFGGGGTDVAYGVVAASFSLGGGNWAYEFTITGSFEGTVSFGGTDLVSAGGSDGFVARLDGAGNHTWSSRFGDAGDDAGHAISPIVPHEVTVAGSVSDAQLGTSDVFIARYNAAGATMWSHTYGGPLDDVGRCISGGVVSGEFRDQASFGGTPLVSAGGADVFVARYDETGAHLWSRQFGGAQDDAGLAVTGTYCTGFFRGTVNFGGGNLTSAGGEDIFLLKLDANGLHQYSRRYGGTGNDAGTGIQLASSNLNIELVGRFAGTVNFGLNALTSAGGTDGFLSLFTDAGANRRNVRMGGTGNDTAHGISDFHLYYPPEGLGYDVAVVGSFTNSMDLGGGPLVSAGGDDAFVVAYSETWLTPVGPSLPDDRLTISSYPNPFNPMTAINYSLPSAGPVTVAIHDVNGARVATLVNGEAREAGPHEVRWRGQSDDGSTVASGVYFARIEHAGAVQSTRLVLLK
ncbi:MAG TPA: T9SS type A sorting domain-containing protein [Gemmatimonadaceae bacterium]